MPARPAGSLRDTLVDAALALIARKGPQGFTFGLLVQAFTECQAAGQVRSDDVPTLAVAAWAIVHGLAALLIDGKLKDHAGSPAAAERLSRA